MRDAAPQGPGVLGGRPHVSLLLLLPGRIIKLSSVLSERSRMSVGGGGSQEADFNIKAFISAQLKLQRTRMKSSQELQDSAFILKENKCL